MIDLNYTKKESGIRNQDSGWQPEEIACAIIAGLIWLPLAFIFGGLL